MSFVLFQHFFGSNPYLDEPSPIATSAQLSASGELAEAILAAEAAVRKDMEKCVRIVCH